VAQRIDKMFSNSRAETLTETEKAFQLGFVSMTEAILLVIQVVSFLVIAIIMAVMANTMAMTARERKQEYATLKALGFPGRFIVGLIFGESLLLALVAGAVGVICIFPTARYVATKFGTLFPIFTVSDHTLWMAGAAALIVGLVAALAPVAAWGVEGAMPIDFLSLPTAAVAQSELACLSKRSSMTRCAPTAMAVFFRPPAEEIFTPAAPVLAKASCRTLSLALDRAGSCSTWFTSFFGSDLA